MSSLFVRLVAAITACHAAGVFAASAPQEVALADLNEGLSNGCAIVTTGVVTEIRDDEIDVNYKRLMVRDGDRVIPVFVHTGHVHLPPDLAERRIRLSGSYNTRTDGGRKYSGPYIGLKSLTVLDGPAPNPFSAPPLDTSLYQTPKELARMGRRTVSGQVLARWNNTRLLMRSDDGSTVLVFCQDGVVPPAAGAMITASGFPDTDRFHLIVTRATIRVEDRPAPSEDTARPVRAEEIVSTQNGRTEVNVHFNGKLVSIEGVIRSRTAFDDSRRLARVECQGLDIPVDFTAAPEAFAQTEIGCTVRLTGRCLITAADWSPFDSYPQLGQVTLLLRRSGDVTILTRPPWWTPARLMVIIGILIAILILVAFRASVLRRLEHLKIAERTRLAVELHDSLSQALAGLACQIAAAGEDLRNGRPSVRDKLSAADRMLKSCRTELRHCLFDLRNDTLDEKDLAQAIRRTIESLLPYASVSIRFAVRRSLLDDTTVHALLAIIRELVTNAIRHGQADTIRIAGSVEDGRLLFSVTDDGRGFDPQTCPGIGDGHFGLNGIRERVNALRGKLQVDSAPGRGTYARITIPIHAK